MSSEQPEKRVDESDFLEFANGPAEARAVRKALETIASGGAGGTLKEMAQEVLSGRLGLREAMNVSAYSEPMVEQVHAARARWDNLSEREREVMAAQGERYLEEQQREIDEELRERQQKKSTGRNPRARHDGSWSLY